MMFRLHDFQQQALAAEDKHRADHPDETRLAIVLPTGTGKAQPVDEPVLTPGGWRKMGELAAGDLVFGSAGLPVEVLSIHPQGIRPTVEITFADGGTVRCDRDHLWTVQTRSMKHDAIRRGSKPWRTVTAEFLLHSEQRWNVPVVAPLVYPESMDLPIDPYTLGVLLGDGGLSQPKVVNVHTHPDVAALLKVPAGHRVVKFEDDDPIAHYRLVSAVGRSANLVLNALREMGLSGHTAHGKFIPERYLRSSPSQRLALLQGLMDTDGSPTGNGSDYVSVSRELINGVAELVRSLGGHCKISQKATSWTWRGEKKHSTAWRAYIKLPRSMSPFLVERKASRLEGGQQFDPVRRIVSVIEVEPTECVCITVNAEDHLYVTSDYVLTHNSTILAERARRFIEDPMSAGQRVLVIVHTEELVEQLAASCRFAASLSDFPISVGVVKAERDETTADIIVASRQTLEIPERRAQIADVGLVIVDEIHIGPSAYGPVMAHFGCLMCQDCVDATEQVREDAGDDTLLPSYCPDGCWTMRRTPALGFTATMERSDGAGLGGIWQNVVFTRDISWAVRKGYLVQPVGYRLEIPIASAEPGEQDAILCDGIAPERIVEKWLELAADRQTIVFAPLVRSADKLRDAFRRKAGVVTETIHGDMPAELRRSYIARFKAGRIQVLCNAMVLTAGFDAPGPVGEETDPPNARRGVGCVIVARPTKSRTLFVQMAGRGLRRCPGIPVEEQDCILITLTDGTSDLCSVADLSDRALDPRAEGALTVMEDAFDLGKDLEEASRHWAGKVDATRFDPIVARSSKVWAKTKAGHWFLPISTEREYVFLVGTDVWALTRRERLNDEASFSVRSIACLHAGLPDVEIAMQVAEDEATERGGDLGALVADRTRPWRKAVPKPGDKMLAYASRLGLDGEVQRILASPAGGKAGKVSDLIRRVEASRSIDRAVIKIKERAGE